MTATDFGSIHSGPHPSPEQRASKQYSPVDGAYHSDMNAHSPRRPQTYAQPVSVADALISALRSPAHAAPVLRPIADELEARRADR